MQKERTVYKVVRVGWQNDYYSCYTTEEDTRIRYTIGKTAYPKLKNSKIFCFVDLGSAREFVFGHSTHFIILKCHAQVSVMQLNRRASTRLAYYRFWKDPNEYIDRELSSSMPSGTVLCDWVKPIGLVPFSKPRN